MAESPAGKNEQPGRMPSRPVGTVRVDIARQEHKTFEAIFRTEDKSFQLMIDEPKIRGGKGRERALLCRKHYREVAADHDRSQPERKKGRFVHAQQLIRS